MTDKSGIKYAAAALLLIFAAGMLTSCNIFGLGGETIILTDPESEEIPAPETDPETEPVTEPGAEVVPTETAPVAEEKGCASAVSSSAIILALCGVCFVRRKLPYPRGYKIQRIHIGIYQPYERFGL